MFVCVALIQIFNLAYLNKREGQSQLVISFIRLPVLQLAKNLKHRDNKHYYFGDQNWNLVQFLLLQGLRSQGLEISPIRGPDTHLQCPCWLIVLGSSVYYDCEVNVNVECNILWLVLAFLPRISVTKGYRNQDRMDDQLWKLSESVLRHSPHPFTPAASKHTLVVNLSQASGLMWRRLLNWFLQTVNCDEITRSCCF